MNNFKKLGICDELSRKLKKQGIVVPTPVQKLTIPSIIYGKDIMAEAQTGTGKTLAFLLPIFQGLEEGRGGLQALILTPTRELAIQIASEAKKLADGSGIKILSVFGGQDIGKQLRKLSGGVDIAVATPGRLIDHLRRGSIDLNHLKTLVLDEADQMLLIGFKSEIEMILKSVNANRQTLCFSATLDSKVKKLAYRHMKSPMEFSAKKETVTLEKISQKLIFSSDRWKQEALIGELDRMNPFMGIIFCRTKRRADKLEEELAMKGYDCRKLHSDMPQNRRARVMKEFRQLKFQYLIATDIASRGLDITGVTHIFNYDIPESPEAYIHRIGRTGRMGEDGVAVTFASPRDLEKLLAIEKEIKMRIPREEHMHVSEAGDSDKRTKDVAGKMAKANAGGRMHRKAKVSDRSRKDKKRRKKF